MAGQFDLPMLREQIATLALFRSADDQDPLLLDHTIEESVARRAIISENPIEVGSDNTDHIRFQAPEIPFRGLFMNEPSDPVGAAQRAGLAGTFNQDQDTGLDSFVDELEDFRDRLQEEARRVISGPNDPLKVARARGAPVDKTRAQQLLDDMRGLYASATLVIVITGTSPPLENCVIREMTERMVGPGTIEVTGVLQQVKISSTRQVDLPVTDVPAAKPPKKVTTKSGAPATPAQVEQVTFQSGAKFGVPRLLSF